MATTSGFLHVDLTGMNKYPMEDAPVVIDAAHVKRLLDEGVLPLSVAGMRHSQGGHTAIKDGRMLISETFNRVQPEKYDQNNPPNSVVVDAGATWSEIHRQVCGLRRTPRVQQSSAHFSVGGSLSVNCHGREVRWGPVSETVEEITVLTGKGQQVTASKNTNTELFKAALGGYGACGMILSAKLKLTPNFMVFRNWELRNLKEYQSEVQGIDTHQSGGVGKELHFHHGWVNVSSSGYLDEVLRYNVREQLVKTDGNEDGIFEKASQLKSEGWGTSELLRAGWAASRLDPKFRQFVWDRLSSRAKNPQDDGNLSRLDFLREDILFTSSKGDAEGVDLLQEYFLPLDKLEAFIGELKKIFPYEDDASDVKLMSCTTRYVRGESENPIPYLSYCRGEPRVSVAIDAHVKRDTDGRPTTAAGNQFRAAIQAAIEMGGTYYLPYYGFATPDQFTAGYPDWEKWREVVSEFNPNRRFNNEFLKQYTL
jgi:FAD/FMN-containing dehydrogenase